MRIKRTRRVFTLEFPTGEVEKQMVREFVRDVDGTDHPHDKFIDVPVYKTKQVEGVFHMIADPGLPHHMTEREVLMSELKGTRAIRCEDIVEFFEIPDELLTDDRKVAEK